MQEAEIVFNSMEHLILNTRMKWDDSMENSHSSSKTDQDLKEMIKI